MTPNQSLELTYRIQKLLRQDMLQFLEPIFPVDTVKRFVARSTGKQKRDRVYTDENTLLTMLVTAVHADKSLQNSVTIFQEIFRRDVETTRQQELERLSALQEEARRHPRVGRPSHYQVKLPLSKVKEISLNTAAYSKARSRIDLALLQAVFKATTESAGLSCVRPWHGRVTYNTDGTYFQMQDSPLIPEKYRVQKDSDGSSQGYPQGLLQVLTQHGSGFLVGYTIAGRGASELRLARELAEELPPRSLLLADALYNCFAFFSYLLDRKIDVIVPDKKSRRYTVLRSLDVNDEIVELPRQKGAMPLSADQVLPQSIIVRRIVYPDAVDTQKSHVLMTTILDQNIRALEIVQKYSSRWDVEITIREIKTLLDMDIARAKSEEMVFKEIAVALSAYNLIRRVVAESVQGTDFSPQEDIVQKLFTAYQNPLVDRKGRVYSRWSSGRPPMRHDGHPLETYPLATGASLSP